MPELPEVETVCRGIAPSLEGDVIEHIIVNHRGLRLPVPENFEAVLLGARIERVERRAKYIIVRLDNDWSILWHLGMSGSVSVRHEKAPVFAKHDHIIWRMKKGAWLIYNDPRRFGLMICVPSAELEGHKLLHSIGPEPFSNGFSGPQLKAALLGKNTSIKQAILDQKIVAGVGNIYASEALFRAAIKPTKKAKSLTLGACEDLSIKIRQVLAEAIQAGGSSLKDHAQVNGELGYFQHGFQVYDREGEGCLTPACVGQIKRVVLSGRSTFYCGKCQK